MLVRKRLAISLFVAISVAGVMPDALAKRVSTNAGKQEVERSVPATEGGADAAASDADVKDIADIAEKSDKLVTSGKLDDAIDVLHNGLRDHGQNPHLRERLSRIYYSKGDIDDAISELLAAISLDPTVFDYYSDVSWLYSISGNYNEAIKYAKLAQRIDANKAYPYVVMGFSLGCLGKRKQAGDLLQKAIELEPHNATAHLYLADVLAGGGDYAKALPMYQKSLKLQPKTASAFVGLGDCFQKLGHPKEALAAYKRAVDLAPQDPTARGHLGFALSQSGDYMGGMKHGMAANSIRLGQYWGKFMGMFIAVWAGIFILVGTIFSAMFMGSRFNPQQGEAIVNQFVMIFYKDQPGRFVITNRRLVFIPEMVSRWFGASRVSILRDDISSIKAEDTAVGGTLLVTSLDETVLSFVIPAVILAPVVNVLKDQGLLKPELPPAEEPKEVEIKTQPAPEKDDQSDTANFERNAIIAACFDFRQQEEALAAAEKAGAFDDTKSETRSFPAPAKPEDQKPEEGQDQKGSTELKQEPPAEKKKKSKAKTPKTETKNNEPEKAAENLEEKKAEGKEPGEKKPEDSASEQAPEKSDSA